MNDSKILKKRQNRNESIISKKSSNSNLFDQDPTDKIRNYREELSTYPIKKGDGLNLIKDISGITQKDQYYIKDHINNSIFNFDNMSSENFNQDDEDLNRLKNLEIVNKNKNILNTNEMELVKKTNDSAKILGDFYFNVSKLFL